jgi:hypothetical protein
MEEGVGGTRTRRRGANNSSRTRVRPVFIDLERQTDDWVSALLSLPASYGVACQPAKSFAELRLQPAIAQFTDGKGRKERSFSPPISLLRWLVDNARPKPNQPESRNVITRVLRDCLLVHRDPEVRERALKDLEKGGRSAAWCTFENATFPDVVIETPDALIVIEGKFTERGRTTRTTWMGGRDQMLRHLDGAWEVRGAKTLVGMFVVEGEAPDSNAVPKSWRDACKALRSDSVLDASLPHRSPDERKAIASCFVGVVTWQAIARAFNLPFDLLSPRV